MNYKQHFVKGKVISNGNGFIVVNIFGEKNRFDATNWQSSHKGFFKIGEIITINTQYFKPNFVCEGKKAWCVMDCKKPSKTFNAMIIAFKI